ncbi:aldehyde dehydrogenase family protein [Schlesneria paludicola]|uniref:aldehyde dehydrogenase family protein n=1 Tax=Schlesneria paludicola TaxID=360056 RepID=UPI00029B5148|nr:aldehyde dehydrogenase family protein [Schlesneria paludicola]
MKAWPNQLFIDGKWVDGSAGRTWDVMNPATGKVLAAVAIAEAEDVDRAVLAARRAFDEGPWPRLDALVRGRMLYQLAQKIRERLDDFAMTDTLNVGKPIRDTRGFDVPCAADLFESYAGLPDKIAGKCYGTLPDNVTMQFREPMGVIAAIVPWNFPLTNLAIKLAPILACGNTVVLKPSEVSPLSALMVAELAQEVGFPEGVINVIHGTGAETGTPLIRHRGIDKITFTGRHQTGVQMLEAAKIGMKGVMLELGGKTPSLVFPDAPIENVVNGVITGIFFNLGQVCVAGSRLLVHESQHADLLERIVAKVKSLRQGDPTDPNIQLGCLANPQHLATVKRYVDVAKSEGARCVLTGPVPTTTENCFFPPTIFDGVKAPMTIAREEVFGPVLSVLTYRDEAEAVRIANDCDFGLMANIWSTDGTRALRVARQLKAGRITINGGGALRPNVPVFGYKLSGIGAELGYEETVHEYTSSKAVIYSLSTEKSPWPE